MKRHPNSNMKLEQLNKHEEKSYIEDAEANEAILKNTVSKEELSRFLTPLKFLEIETWRKEVPFGDTIDEAEVEHRRWRTPIEILLPTVGREDDGLESSYDGINGSSRDDSTSRKKSTSTNSRRRKFFEDVQRQNAELLQRSQSDVRKLDFTRPRIRDTVSAGEKPQNRQSIEKQQDAQRRNEIGTAEGRLRTAYAPANAIPPYRDARQNPRKSGHIYVNQALPNTANVNGETVVASCFSPGKPVLARIRSKNKVDNSRSAATTDSKSRLFTSVDRRPSQLSNYESPIKGHRISSSTWPGNKVENGRVNDRNGFEEDVQVLPINRNRPQTVGDEPLGNRNEPYQRHPKFRGAHRAPARGWRHWNGHRSGIETSFSAATRLYQNSVHPRRISQSRTIEKNRQYRSASNSRESSPRSQQKSSSLPQSNGAQKLAEPTESDQNPRQSAKTTRSATNGNSTHVTKISYALNRPNEIKVRTLQGPKQRETMSRVTPIPPIEMSLSTTEKLPIAGALYAEATENGGLKYISAEGVIELNAIPTSSNSPWVAEAFTPALGSNERYYNRQHRQNKTVTFRLGAT